MSRNSKIAAALLAVYLSALGGVALAESRPKVELKWELVATNSFLQHGRSRPARNDFISLIICATPAMGISSFRMLPAFENWIRTGMWGHMRGGMRL